MHRAVILIGPRRRERDGVRLAVAAHDRTARKRGRSLGLDAVGNALIVGPGPCHGRTHCHRVDRRVPGAVVGADEHDLSVVSHGYGPDRPSATRAAPPPPPLTPPPPPPPAPPWARPRCTAATPRGPEGGHSHC